MKPHADYRALANASIGMLPRRWAHVQGVGRAAEELAIRTGRVSPAVVAAAWLHDVGYGPDVQATGFHPLDGARHLATLGIDSAVVNLVAFHTGAAFEAAERGFARQLAEFDRPSQSDLDVLTMIDLAVGPDGSPMVDRDRLLDVLRRYQAADPVARAVGRSQRSLLRSSQRAKERLGLPDEWPICA